MNILNKIINKLKFIFEFACNYKYTLIILGSFSFSTFLFFLKYFSGDLDDVLFQLKWFMRITFPLFVIYFIYLGTRD